MWRGPPLFLESEGAFPGRRTSEIENPVPVLAPEFQAGPVQEHVRARPIVFTYGGSPGNLQYSLESDEKPGCHGIILQINGTYACRTRENLEDIFKEGLG